MCETVAKLRIKSNELSLEIRQVTILINRSKNSCEIPVLVERLLSLRRQLVVIEFELSRQLS